MTRLHRDILLYSFGWLVCVAGLVLPLYFLEPDPKPAPVPTEATELMVETFEAVAEKQGDALARCMSLIEICERARLTFDAQMKAVFEVTKKDICK